MITTLPGHMNNPASDNVDSTHSLNPFSSMKRGLSKMTRQVKGMRNVTSLPTGMKTSAHKPIYNKPTIFDRRKINMPQVRESINMDVIFKQALIEMMIETSFGPMSSPAAGAPIGGSGPMLRDQKSKLSFHRVSGGTSLVNKSQAGPSSQYNPNPKVMLKPIHNARDISVKRSASWPSRGTSL